MNLYDFLYKVFSAIMGFFFLYLWMLGIVISPSWWEKVISICFFPYALYLVVERNQFF